MSYLMLYSIWIYRQNLSPVLSESFRLFIQSILKSPTLYEIWVLLKIIEQFSQWGVNPYEFIQPECISPLYEVVKGDLWLQVKKPVIPPVPELPIELEKWLEETTRIEDITQTPKLKDKIKNTPHIESNEVVEGTDENQPNYLYLKEQPNITKEFDSYLTNLWIPWRDEYIRSTEIQRTYSQLFTIYLKQKTSGEQFELNVSLGLFNWKTPNGQLVHRHLLTIPCSFTFD